MLQLLVQFDHAFPRTYQHITSVKDYTSAKRLVYYGPHEKQSPIALTSSCRMLQDAVPSRLMMGRVEQDYMKGPTGISRPECS
jgi:hypothetical protein